MGNGGWTSVLLRNTSLSNANFTAGTWAQFKAGFGSGGDLFLGLDFLNSFTSVQTAKLRVEITFGEVPQTRYIEYSSFAVGDEASNYVLTVSGPDTTRTLCDALSSNNGNAFSTQDVDNDASGASSVSALYGQGGWFKGTSNGADDTALLMGDWNGTFSKKGVNWGCFTTFTQSATSVAVKMMEDTDFTASGCTSCASNFASSTTLPAPRAQTHAKCVDCDGVFGSTRQSCPHTASAITAILYGAAVNGDISVNGIPHSSTPCLWVFAGHDVKFTKVVGVQAAMLTSSYAVTKVASNPMRSTAGSIALDQATLSSNSNYALKGVTVTGHETGIPTANGAFSAPLGPSKGRSCKHHKALGSTSDGIYTMARYYKVSTQSCSVFRTELGPAPSRSPMGLAALGLLNQE
jgi:hypothetical protein